jgi:hypothetical protein
MRLEARWNQVLVERVDLRNHACLLESGWLVMKGRREGEAGLRWRRKNTNTPKAANPTTPPLTAPAIAPTFVFLEFVGYGLT